MAVKAEAQPYLDVFRDDAAEPAWLRDARRAALAAFGERGFPSRREEAWRFTRLQSLGDRFFAPPRRKPGSMVGMDTGLRRYGTGEIEGAYRLVLADGMLQSAPRDLPQGVWFASMARTVAERPDLARRAIGESDLAGGQPFASLNAALFADGFVLALDGGVVLDRPIEILHLAATEEPASIHLRNVIALAPNSRATVIETYAGRGHYWTNAVGGIALGAGAALDHVKVQDESRDAIHFGMARIALGDKARYRNFGLTLGASLSRNEVQVRHGNGSDAAVSGAYLQRGDQDTTSAIVIDHAAPGATTRELFKGVLDERAHGAFLGTIRVREGAQRTDAQQTSRALLLSDRASVDTKPELEILADDVKCAHGAAVGDIDKETLFYLRARGIGIDAARRMLIEAFVLETLETVEMPELRAHLVSHVRRWLGEEGA